MQDFLVPNKTLIMDKKDIINKVIQAIAEVQEASGRADNGIVASTCPLTDVEGFDSLCGVEATVMFSKSLGVTLPEKCNPFISEDGKRAKSVSEIADTLCNFVGAEA